MMNALQQVSSPMYLVPAFGQVYPNSTAMHEAWKQGKSFRIVGGPYTSIRDLEQLRHESSSITLCDPRSEIKDVRV